MFVSKGVQKLPINNIGISLMSNKFISPQQLHGIYIAEEQCPTDRIFHPDQIDDTGSLFRDSHMVVT